MKRRQDRTYRSLASCGLVLTLLLIAVAGRVSYAQQAAEQRFYAGNEAYTQGQFDIAIEAYREVLDAGYVSGALYYNLGNAYYRTGQTGQAIRYYEKARQLTPQNPRLLHSLEVARDEIDAAVPTRTQPSGLIVLAQQIPAVALLIVGMLLYGGGLVVQAYMRWVTASLGAVYRYGSLGALALGLILTVTALAASYGQTLDRRAIVISASAPVRSAPQAEAPTDTTLSEGHMVRVQRQRRDWSRVELPQGTTGWIAAGDIGDI